MGADGLAKIGTIMKKGTQIFSKFDTTKNVKPVLLKLEFQTYIV